MRTVKLSAGLPASVLGQLLVAAVLVAAAAAGSAALGQVGPAPDYAKERAERAKALTAPYGWFSLIALEWLKPGATTVGSAADNSCVVPGAPPHLMTLNQSDGKVALVKADNSLTLNSKRLGAGEFPAVVGEGEDPGSALASGSLRMWAIKRGGTRYLRVKDSKAPALKHFHGLRWYAPDPHFRVVAKWVPYSSPHTLAVVNKLGQTTPTSVPGYVEFKIDGKKQTLVPVEADEKDGLFFVFRDLTARHMTDGGGRFLSTEAPSSGLGKPGTVVIDFNEAENPPCAYSPYATCPLASPENRLKVAVPAGEKRYED